MRLQLRPFGRTPRPARPPTPHRTLLPHAIHPVSLLLLAEDVAGGTHAPTHMPMLPPPPPQFKPPDVHAGLGRHVQKLLVLPKEHLAALYSSKLALGVFRLQFVAGYFWDRHCPTLDFK